MNVLLNIVLLVQVLSALGMIGLILVQHGKGADMGAAFGSGASGSLFGASGGANVLSRVTAGLAALFFASTLVLAYFGNKKAEPASSVLSGVAVTAPAASSAAVAIPAGSAAVAAPAASAASAAPVNQIPAK